jgi:uncharacterized membrane protein YdjX (TVP38/TMEM64 family)
MEGHPKFKAIDDAVAREGWKIVALIRLAPVFPFSLTSYAFGLTRLPWWQYFLANFAMIPGTVMYIYFGYLARATFTDDVPGKINTPMWVKWIVAVLTVTVVIYVARFAKRALAQKVS